MERVLVIGCGGAGKSTLSRELGKRTGLPVVHLDQLFWHPGWVESARNEMDEKIRMEMEKDCWIMDGNYNRTLPERLSRCDTVIYLDFNRLQCLRGVAKRIITSYGKVRPDMSEGCPERFDWEFIKWVWNFNQTKRKRIYHLLAQQKEKQVYILRSRRQVKRFLKTVCTR